MATKKDLVEAYSFNRRRLVTAFLSGAPGGREVEPVKPARSLVGGLALAVLLCAGAAITGFVGGRPSSDWKSPGTFVVSQDTGEQYVVLRGETDNQQAVIQRVPNFVSVQLLLGTSDPRLYSVKDKYIRQVTLGPDLGIDRAPASLPDAADLLSSGWTGCTGDRLGVKIDVSPRPDVQPAIGQAFAVRTKGGEMWLIAPDKQGHAYRLRLPETDQQSAVLLDSLGFPAASEAPKVSDDWLNLFAEGADLSTSAFAVTDEGAQPAYWPEGDVKVGDLLRYDGAYYLVADEATEHLSDFAGHVYESVHGPAIDTSLDPRPTLGAVHTPASWPEQVPAPATGGAGGELCAILRTDAERTWIELGTSPGDRASAVGLEAGAHDVDVDPAGGAYVLIGGAGQDTAAADAASRGGSAYVVDAQGAKYPLVGPQVATCIGYADVKPPVVPDAWMEFFAEGVPLSVNAARRVPEDAPVEGATGG